MKNTLKKNIALACMLTVGLSAAAVGGSLMGVSASAAESTFTLFDGASIRDNAPAGIRFETTISATEYADYVSQGATFGTVIIPAWKLGANTLVKGYEGSVNVPAEHVIEVVKDDEATEDVNESVMQYNAVMVGKKDAGTGVYAGLPTGMYNIKLVARSYVEIGGEVVAYAKNTAIRSFAQVAAMEIVDPTDPTDGEVLDYMHEITDYVATLEANVLDDVSINTAEENYATTITLPEDCGEVYGVYLLPSNYTIGTGAYTVSANEVTFTKEFIGSLDYGDYNLKINAENGCYSVTASIYAESTHGDTRFIGFDRPDELNNIVTYGDKEWLADYNGAKGVVKARYSTSASNGFMYKTDMTIDELKALSWDYITFRVFVAGAEGSRPEPVYEVGDKYSYFNGSFASNQWYIINMPKTTIETVSGLDYFYENITGEGIELFWAWNATDVDWYIDYVDFVENSELSTFDGAFLFNEYHSVDTIYNCATAGWLESYEGATGVVSVPDTGTGYHPILTLKSTYTVDALTAMDWDFLEFRVYIASSASSVGAYHEYSTSAYYSWSFPVNQWKTQIVTKSWMLDLYADDSVFYSLLSRTGNGLPLIRSNATIADTTVYVDYIAFRTYEEAAVEDFATVDTASQFTTEGTEMVDIGWESMYLNANGVVKGTNNAESYGSFGIKASDAFIYAYKNSDWTSIEFVVTVVKAAGDESTSWQFSTSAFSSGSWPGGSYGEWKTISYTKESITTNSKFDSLATALTNGTPIFSTNGTTLQGATIYVDCIRLVYA